MKRIHEFYVNYSVYFCSDISSPCFISEEYVALTAREDGDEDRIERMRMYDDLWIRASARIEVNYFKCYYCGKSALKLTVLQCGK
jgi:hypothetical protein